MKDRIKLVRKNAGATQEAFGKSIGLSRMTIAHVETDYANLTDRSIKDICRVYGVNEEWLRTGKGDVYRPKTRQQEILEFVNNAMEDSDDDTREFLLYCLTKFEPEEWHLLKEMFKKINKMFNENNKES